MEAFDQPWKTSFEGRAAGYWGMLDLDRHAKWAMTGPVMENPDWLGLGARRHGRRGAARRRCCCAAARISASPASCWWPGWRRAFAACSRCVLLAMAGKYLSPFAAVVWGTLAAGQALLLFLLMADSFELAETVFGVEKRRHPLIVPAPRRHEAAEGQHPSADLQRAAAHGAADARCAGARSTTPTSKCW